MSSLRLKARVPSARFICTATLFEHELKYHKLSQVDGSAKCDAFNSGNPSTYVLGVVYDINAGEKKILDEIEGLGVGYEEKTVAVVNKIGEQLTATTYYASLIQSNLKPFHWYKEHVIRGALEFNLPKHYISRFVDVACIQDCDQRTRNELSIYQ